MWISKREYEALKDIAESNRDYADEYRSLIYNLEYGNALKLFRVNHTNCVAMNLGTFSEIYNKRKIVEDKLKELEAELVWYKNKYHEKKRD